MLEREIINQKAGKILVILLEGRFGIYIFVIVIILCFLLGIYFKKAAIFYKVDVMLMRLVRYLQAFMNKLETYDSI